MFEQEGHKLFLQEHHFNGDYIFWLDLARCYFARPTSILFDELEIQFFTKAENPPSVANLDLWKISGACRVKGMP